MKFYLLVIRSFENDEVRDSLILHEGRVMAQQPSICSRKGNRFVRGPEQI